MASTPPPPPEEEEPIIVTGTRPKEYDPGTGGDPGTGEPGGGETGGGGGGGDPTLAPLTTQQEACRAQRADESKDEINTDPDSSTHENGKIVYRDASGAILRSGMIQGTRLGIPQSAWEAEMTRLGIDRSDIIGIVHNHPAAEYSDYPDIQRYPSGGDVPGGDWDAADWFVAGGAGGSDDNFSLFVIDTGGTMREFRYSDRDRYKNLDQEERERGEALPPAMESDGTAC